MTKPVHQKYQIYPNLTKASWNSSDPFWVQRWCPNATSKLWNLTNPKPSLLQPAVSLPLLFWSSPAPQTQTKNTKGNMESRDGPPGQARPPSPARWLRLWASLLITKLHPSLQCLSIPDKTSAMVLLGLSSFCLLPQVIATPPWVRQKNVNVYWSQTYRCVVSLFSQITSGNCGLRRVSLVLSHAQSELQAWLMNTYIIYRN